MRIRFFLLLAVLGGLFGCSDAPPDALTPCKKDSDCPHDWFCLEDNFCYAHPGGLTGQAGARQLPPGNRDAAIDGSFNDASVLDASSDLTDAELTDSGMWSFLDAAVDGSVDGAIDPETSRLGVAVTGDGLVTIEEADTDLECDDRCGPRFITGSSVKLTAVPPEGMLFASWAGACSGTELTCTLVLEKDMRVIATFKPIMHTLDITKLGAGGGTVTADGASITCGSTCTAMVAYGTSVTLTGTPNATSLFGGWSGDACTGVAPCTFVVKSDLHVSATFPLDSFTLVVSRAGTGSGSVSSVPAGISCGADCNESFSANQVVTLNATASAGSTFTGWSGGDCSGTGACSVTLSDSKTVTATFTLQTFAFTVARSGNGSGTVTSQPAAINCGASCGSTQGYGSMLTLTAAAAADSTFAGWSGAGCSGTGTCSVTINAVSTVTATFTLKKFDLTTAKSGNGSGQITSGDGKINCGATCSAAYDSGQMVTLTPVASTGSTFTGWSGSCTGSGACMVTLTAARSVTASFTLQRFALSVSKSGNGSGSVAANSGAISCGATCSDNYDYGQNVTLTASTVVGSTFTGWGGACSGTGSCVVAMTAVKSVTAGFTLQQVALQVSKSGTGSGTVNSADAKINCGATCASNYNFGSTATLTAAPASNSTFVGWGGACSGTGTCSVTLNNAVNVSAVFTLKKYRLTVAKAGNGAGSVSSNVGGIACGGTCFDDYDAGQMITLTAAPSTGSTFTGWSGACSGTGACTVTLNAASTATATFTLQQLALSVSKSGNGAGTVDANSGALNCGSTCNASYDFGQSVTLTATASTGSTFTGWSGACTGTGTCSVSMTAARTVTASFTLRQLILSVSKTGSGGGTVTSGDGQTNCGATCSPSYNFGSTVTLTAAPDANSTFTGWSGACTGTGTCTVAVNAAVSVGAAFTIKTIRLSVAKSGNGTGTITSNVGGISCGGTCFADYNSGQTVTLSAAPGTGSDFTGWSGGGCSGTGTCTVALSSMTSVTAAFTLKRFTITVQRAGAGSGSVTASSGAINCGNACSDTYNYGQTIALTANPSTGSQLGAWSGACTGNGSCSVMVTGNATVMATFTLQQFTLSVSRSGTGSTHGYVSSIDQQIDCGAACGATYTFGSSVTLNASVDALGTFSGWTGACSGTGACTVTIAGNTTVGAAFVALPNYAFVTTATSAGGLGYAAAESQCNDEAKKAGLPGTYVAWLSTDGANPISAVSRLGKARGWIRPDGEPVADRAAELVSATPANLHTYYPIRLSASGNDLGHLAVFTGTGSDGKTTMATCTSWSSIATSGTVGFASATGLDFTAFGPSSCRVPHAFYCFGIDNTSTLSFKPIGGRKAFVTRKPFVPSSGIGNADKLCQDEADAAGVSGTFLALLATAEQPASARFDTQGATWVRMDGIPLAKSAALAMARATTLWDAPLNIAADGGELYDQRVWSGVPDGQAGINPLSLPGGNQNNTCNDWVSNKNTANAGRIGDSFLQSGFAALGQLSCGLTTMGVACLQK